MSTKATVKVGGLIIEISTNPEYVEKPEQTLCGRTAREVLDMSVDRERFQRLRDAVERLYYSATWETNDLGPDRAEQLWRDVRDAAGFKPGLTAASLGKARF